VPEHTTLRGFLAARPAIRLAVLLAAGILLSDVTYIWPSVVCAFFIATGSVAVVCSAFDRLGSAAIIFLHISMLLLGSAMYSVRSSTDNRLRLDPVSESDPVVLTGSVIAPPTPTRSGWSLIVRPERLIVRGLEIRNDRDVLVYVRSKKGSADGSPANSGEHVVVHGLLDRFPRPKNPGEFDYGLTLSMNGIEVVVRADSLAANGRVLDGSSMRLLNARVQEALYDWLDRLHPPEHAAFLKGLMLGYRAELSDELKEAFQVTGTVHILAVSGSNVALVALVALAFAGSLRVGRRIMILITLISLAAYMVVTGSSPSVVRATIMGAIVVASGLCSRRTDAVQSLAVAAVILLLVDPRNVFDVGFQLSFVSVASLIIGVPYAAEWTQRFPEEIRESRILSGIVQLMSVTVVAQIGTLPLTAAYFGRVSIAALLVNMIVVPLSGLVLLVGVAETAFMTVWEGLASVYATVNDALMAVLLGLVRRASAIPYAAVDIDMPGPLTVVLWYNALVLLLAWRTPRLRAWTVCTMFVLLDIVVWLGVVSAWRPRAEWTTLDVGQGDAHILRSMRGSVMMVDAGPSPEVAERAIIPWLKRAGIERIDLLVLSHPHADHIGGAGVLLDRIPVRTLAVDDTAKYPLWLRSSAWRAGTRMINVARGDRLDPDASMRAYVVHPGTESRNESANNRSVVVKVMIGGTSVLCTGDAEEEAETLMVLRYGTFLAADVLKVAHHGSATGTTDLFLDCVNPVSALVSVGWRNKFHHPSSERMAELRQRDVHVLTTSLVGAARLSSDGTVWSPVAWR